MREMSTVFESATSLSEQMVALTISNVSLRPITGFVGEEAKPEAWNIRYQAKYENWDTHTVTHSTSHSGFRESKNL